VTHHEPSRHGSQQVTHTVVSGEVDEADMYKNLLIPSANQDLALVGKKASKRATDLDMKIDYLRRSRGERVVTFSTGTPIANSLTESYVMRAYLRPDVLTDAGLGSPSGTSTVRTPVVGGLSATSRWTTTAR
jgi:N12 class adenine-specific DNA methylase